LFNNNEPLSRKEREEEFRRNLVLDAAESLFAERGFDGTTVAEIAERSELAKGSLYQLFQSKDEIFSALVKRKMDHIWKLLDEIFSRDISPLEKMRLIMREKLAAVWDSRQFARIFLNELKGLHWTIEPPLMASVHEKAGLGLKRIEVLFEEGQKIGEFRDDLHATTLVAAFAGFTNAIIYTWLNREDDFKMEDALNQAMELFMNGVSPIRREEI
jgi:TetR/AcrR family transcriptional regulator, cholesterol catabolism regulator